MTESITLSGERGPGSPRQTPDVVPGVHRLEHAFTNCYLLVDGASCSRTGTSIMWVSPSVPSRNWAFPVFVHAGARELAAHPYRYRREHAPFVYPLLYPRSLAPVVGMVRAGALSVKGVTAVSELPGSGMLDLPGRPEVVFTPGHTFGHCGLLLRDRETLLSGDAIVTLDPYKGIPGAQIVAGAATADSTQALASLDVIAATGARVLLPGHGEPWLDGAEAAVASARAIGRS